MSDAGRYRRVYSADWLDARVQSLTDGQRVTWLYLTTGPQSTSVGIYRMSPAIAAEELGNVSVREFQRRLDVVVHAFGWKWDPVTKVLWIPEWLKENEPQSPNVCRSWRRLLGDVPDCELKIEAVFAIKVFLKDFAEAFQQAFGDLQVSLPKTFPKTSPIQGSGSTFRESGSTLSEHGRASRGRARALKSVPNTKSEDKDGSYEGVSSLSDALIEIARSVFADAPKYPNRDLADVLKDRCELAGMRKPSPAQANAALSKAGARVA